MQRRSEIAWFVDTRSTGDESSNGFDVIRLDGIEEVACAGMDWRKGRKDDSGNEQPYHSGSPSRSGKTATSFRGRTLAGSFRGGSLAGDDWEQRGSQMKAWRRDLHANPEFGFEEKRTASFVAAKLRAFGLDDVAENIGGTGIVGTLRRGTGNRAIALRAEMDALRIH
jgi:hypothetical protein